MTRQTTEYNQNVWLARCRHATCNEIKIKCPVCKRPGHVTTHVMPANGKQHPVQITIQHSHFLENVDAGRNMFCETGLMENVNNIIPTWRLDPLEKRHLIDEYAERLK